MAMAAEEKRDTVRWFLDAPERLAITALGRRAVSVLLRWYRDYEYYVIDYTRGKSHDAI